MTLSFHAMGNRGPSLRTFFAIFVIIVAVSNAATNPNDLSALQGLYSNLNSPQQLTGWTKTGGDPCGQSWKGITCSGSRVTSIKLSGLGLSGTLYYNLSPLSSLTTLDLSNNAITGGLPYSLPSSLQQLNLNSNQFSGTMPWSISSMKSLDTLNLGHNQMSGQIMDVFKELQSLTTLDLSYNSFTENIPSSFSELSSLNDLYLQNNQLTGTVDELSNLPLQNLNIENNKFTGWVPGKWKSNGNFKFNGNSFTTGPAPPPPPFTPPPPSPTKRSPSNNNSGTQETKGNGDSKKSLSVGAIVGIIIAALIAAGACISAIVCARRPKHSKDIEKMTTDVPFKPLEQERNNSTSFTSYASAAPKVSSVTEQESKLKPESPKIFSKPPQPLPSEWKKPTKGAGVGDVSTPKRKQQPINARAFSIAELQLATESFSEDNLIGEGSLGRIYRAEFPDGTVAAIKKLDTSVIPINKPEDFLEAASLMSSIRYKSITELIGYCAEHDQYLLVYEYFENGSLYDMLHMPDESIAPLSWTHRVAIACGTAKALSCLHQMGVVHQNIKSSNILLDDELKPHLTDCGLSALNPAAGRQVLDTFGYGSPECMQNGPYTTASDVFSFGVVMLELFTGRKPLDCTRPRAEQSLVRWATLQFHDIDALTKMVDPAMEKGEHIAPSLSRFADIISRCILHEPEFRAKMPDIVAEIEKMVVL